MNISQLLIFCVCVHLYGIVTALNTITHTNISNKGNESEKKHEKKKKENKPPAPTAKRTKKKYK